MEEQITFEQVRADLDGSAFNNMCHLQLRDGDHPFVDPHSYPAERVHAVHVAYTDALQALRPTK